MFSSDTRKTPVVKYNSLVERKRGMGKGETGSDLRGVSRLVQSVGQIVDRKNKTCVCVFVRYSCFTFSVLVYTVHPLYFPLLEI